MNPLIKEIRRNPLLWLLVFVAVLFATARLKPEAHTLLFVLSVLAVVPLAALLSHATESVAARTGDTVGGVLNATLDNLTELVIALTALRAGEYTLVKASIAGAIVAYGLSLLFSLATHRELFGSMQHGEAAEAGEAPWPLSLALGTRAGVTVLVALAALRLSAGVLPSSFTIVRRMRGNAWGVS